MAWILYETSLFCTKNSSALLLVEHWVGMHFSKHVPWLTTSDCDLNERIGYERKWSRKHGIQPHAHRKWVTLCYIIRRNMERNIQICSSVFELWPFKLLFDASLSFVYDLSLNLIANLKRVLSHHIRLFCNKNNSPCLLYNIFGSWLSCAIFKSRVFMRNMVIKVKIFQLGYPKVSYGLLSSWYLTIFHWKVHSTCSLL